MSRRWVPPSLWVALVACSRTLDVASLGGGCGANEKECGGACVPRGDPTCPPCPPGTKVCADTCVSIDDPTTGCGAQSCEACAIQHGTATCTSRGECTAAACVPGHKLCAGECVADTLPEFGCARSTCAPCFLPDALASCGVSGECEVASCAVPGLANCVGGSRDGCETNLNESVEHCGKCQRACLPQPYAEVRCTAGRCVIRRCLEGRELRNGVCVLP